MFPNSQVGMERRRFLSCAAGMALPALSPAAPAAGEWRNRQSGMTYRRLGRTGLMVSSIGMGGDDIRPDNNDQVLWAMDQGLNYFDTAPQYGNGLSRIKSTFASDSSRLCQWFGC